MANPTTPITSWSAASLRATDSDIKISEPGLYSGLILTKIEEDAKKMKYTFYVKDSNNYTDMAIFPETNPSYTKSIPDQQKAVIEKLVSIADAVGSPTEVSKLPPASSYEALVKMLHKFIESKKGAKVNLKLVLDAEENFVNVAMFGFIEKYNEGKDPTLFFTTWEKDNNRAKRTKPRPKYEANTKSDTSVAPTASYFSEPVSTVSPFSAETHGMPKDIDGSGLPF